MTIQAFARIIMKREDGRWTACFGDEPHNTVIGREPTETLRTLLQLVGQGHFTVSTVHPLSETSRDGHLEYLAAFQPESFTTVAGCTGCCELQGIVTS